VPFCTNCGTESLSDARFCHNCGRALAVEAVPPNAGVSGTTAVLPTKTIISVERIVFMSILTNGLYFLYWFYVTWKHYRDYTLEEAYPVCHSLTLAVPIYGLFRVHAHIRTFKDLAEKQGVVTTLSPGWVVFGYLVTQLLGLLSAVVAVWVAFTGSGSDVTVRLLLLGLISLAITTWITIQAQVNVNHFWLSLKDRVAVPVSISVCEVILVIIGVFSWTITLMDLAAVS